VHTELKRSVLVVYSCSDVVGAKFFSARLCVRCTTLLELCVRWCVCVCVYVWWRVAKGIKRFGTGAKGSDKGKGKGKGT